MVPMFTCGLSRLNFSLAMPCRSFSALRYRETIQISWVPVVRRAWIVDRGSVVEPTTGFEPVTPSLPRKCSTPEPRGQLVCPRPAGAGKPRNLMRPPARCKPQREQHPEGVAVAPVPAVGPDLPQDLGLSQRPAEMSRNGDAQPRMTRWDNRRHDTRF